MHVDIDDELHKKILTILEQKKIEYVNIRDFVNKAVKEKIEKETG